MITHAHTILLARPQRTAERRFVAPTPTIAPVIVCVVLTGMPKRDAESMTSAPAVSAQKPPTGRSFVMRVPIVCTMRHPPKSVPSEIIVYALSSTHTGIESSEVTYMWRSNPVSPANVACVATRRPTMMPIVFCASLPPCASDNKAELVSCATRKNLSAFALVTFWKTLYTSTIKMNPSSMPSDGDSAIAESVSIHFLPHRSATKPTFDTAAPAYPPMSACDELDGIPNHQVIRFHVIAPSSPPRITFASTTFRSMNPAATDFATAVPTKKSAAKLNTAAQITAANGLRTRVPTIVAIELAES